MNNFIMLTFWWAQPKEIIALAFSVDKDFKKLKQKKEKNYIWRVLARQAPYE